MERPPHKIGKRRLRRSHAEFAVLGAALALLPVAAVAVAMGLLYVLAGSTVAKRLPSLREGRYGDVTLYRRPSDEARAPLAIFFREGNGRLVPKRHQMRPVDARALRGSRFLDALLAAEDKWFLEHNAVDYGNIMKAFVEAFVSGNDPRGASTITQQVARNVILRDRSRSWTRKIDELFVALQLEQRLTKEEILSLYVNGIFTGARDGVQWLGFGEAAAELVGKDDLRDLTLSEAAALAGMTHRPSYYLARASRGDLRPLRRRRDAVLDLMREAFPEGYSREMILEAKRKPLRLRLGEESNSHSVPYFLDAATTELLTDHGEILETGGPLEVSTTLDPGLQRIAEDAVADGLERVDRLLPKSRRGRAEAALIVVDPRSGEILALVGGRDRSRSPYNRAIQARRQIGSLAKPVAFLAAFERAAEEEGLELTPASLVDDEPTTFRWNGRPWRPRNYRGKYDGPITLLRALALSKNIPAVKVAELAGYEYVAKLWRRILPRQEVHAYPSIALGAFELTPAEVASAYTVFATNGATVPLRTISKVVTNQGEHHLELPEPRRVARSESAFVVAEMLQGVLDGGTARGARRDGFNLDAAGKTGTTNDLRDAWFVGFTPELLAVVWVGLDREPLGLTGSQAALPIWTEFMKSALRENVPFEVPDGIGLVDIDPVTGKLAGRGCPRRAHAAFVAGTEPRDVCGEPGELLASSRHARSRVQQ